MSLLSLSNISKSFGARTVFSGVSFTIEDNHHIGLVGVNGCGKTTLLNIIQDKIEYDSGEIFKSKSTAIGFVEQFIINDTSKTVYEAALESKKELVAIEEELARIQKMIEDDKSDLEALIVQKNKLDEAFANKGGYTYKSITNATLKGLGFSDSELELKVEQLSGGQKTKLMLAKMLLSNANLLLLDEPTNNLDIDSIEWLESFLKSYKGSYIVVSHDRYFLDKVTEETYEMEDQKLSIYKGNYSKYLKLKEEKNKTLAKKYEQAEKEISRIEGIIEQQKTWSQERNYKIIKSKQKMISRIEEKMEKPDVVAQKMKFHFKTVEGGNKETLIINGLTKRFGEVVLFKNVNINVYKKERVFLIGSNGCGKTTLIKILQGKLAPDGGNFKIGSNIKTSFYSQTQEEFIENKTILDFVWSRHEELSQTEVRNALAIFLFKGDDVNKNILMLSGGEKARLALLLVMLSDSNLLILDEPTNHLDINAREALENALMEYEGTLFIVSHDRYFMNKLATKIYRLEQNGADEFIGNYDNYIGNYIPKTIENVKTESTNKIAYKEKKEKEAIERKRKNQIEKLEERITVIEDRIKQLENELLKEENATDYEKAMKYTGQIEESKEELLNLYGEWEKMQNSIED